VTVEHVGQAADKPLDSLEARVAQARALLDLAARQDAERKRSMAEATHTRLVISRPAFEEIRRKIAQTNAGLIDDRGPEIEMDGVTITPEPID
jgi:hypothetical protein